MQNKCGKFYNYQVEFLLQSWSFIIFSVLDCCHWCCLQIFQTAHIQLHILQQYLQNLQEITFSSLADKG